jgi:hypothetical protein
MKDGSASPENSGMKALSQRRAPKGFTVGRYSHDAKPGKLKWIAQREYHRAVMNAGNNRWEAAICHPISRSRSLLRLASQRFGS